MTVMTGHDDDTRPALEPMDRATCLALLDAQDIGRLAVIDGDGVPMVVPVNYRLHGESVVFRTAPGSKVVALQRHAVAFEIDGFDHVKKTGWSVLVQGVAHEMNVAEQAGIEVEPWARGDKNTWIQLVPRRISGRRLVDEQPFEPPGGYL